MRLDIDSFIDLYFDETIDYQWFSVDGCVLGILIFQDSSCIPGSFLDETPHLAALPRNKVILILADGQPV